MNLRRLLMILDLSPKLHPLAACLALDLEKAFDSLEWPFLLATLQSFGMPEGFLKYVQLLYSSPTARIRIGRNTSARITIHRGTRQGCPLSPLLFALAMEPLAIALRQGGVGWGLRMGETIHAVSLYADDLLVYINDTSADLSDIALTLLRFQRASGLKVNWDKSCIFPLRQHVPEITVDRKSVCRERV